MTAEQIEHFDKDIESRLSNYYTPSSTDEFPVIDGVVNHQRFLNASTRILWILKEPWDGDGGGWSMTELLDQDWQRMSRGASLQSVVYVTYGILNSIWSWSEMSYIRDKPEMGEVLRDIAYINVKKVPGGKSADNVQVLAAYVQARELVLEQVRFYEPEIVIGCAPHMPVIMEELGIKTEMVQANGTARWASHQGTLYLSVRHPGQRGSRETYIDDILEAVRKQHC